MDAGGVFFFSTSNTHWLPNPMSDKSVSRRVLFRSIPAAEDDRLHVKTSNMYLLFEFKCGFDIVQSNRVHRCFCSQLFITCCCAVWTWFIVYALSWSSHLLATAQCDAFFVDKSTSGMFIHVNQQLELVNVYVWSILAGLKCVPAFKLWPPYSN